MFPLGLALFSTPDLELGRIKLMLMFRKFRSYDGIVIYVHIQRTGIIIPIILCPSVISFCWVTLIFLLDFNNLIIILYSNE